jgi:hypothetical protein
MFLPEIFMYMQCINSASTDAPADRDGVGREAIEHKASRRTAALLRSSGRAPGPQRPSATIHRETRTDDARQPLPTPDRLNEWDEWKSVRDVA